MFLSLHPKNKTLVHLLLSIGNHPRVVLHQTSFNKVLSEGKRPPCVCMSVLGSTPSRSEISNGIGAAQLLSSKRKPPIPLLCFSRLLSSLGAREKEEEGAHEGSIKRGEAHLGLEIFLYLIFRLVLTLLFLKLWLLTFLLY